MKLLLKTKPRIKVENNLSSQRTHTCKSGQL